MLNFVVIWVLYAITNHVSAECENNNNNRNWMWLIYFAQAAQKNNSIKYTYARNTIGNRFGFCLSRVGAAIRLDIFQPILLSYLNLVVSKENIIALNYLLLYNASSCFDTQNIHFDSFQTHTYGQAQISFLPNCLLDKYMKWVLKSIFFSFGTQIFWLSD